MTGYSMYPYTAIIFGTCSKADLNKYGIALTQMDRLICALFHGIIGSATCAISNVEPVETCYPRPGRVNKNRTKDT